MSSQLPTYEFHPELGYLCPSSQLRQNVRVGLAAALFGLIAGLGVAMALLPRHSGDVARIKPDLWTKPVLAMTAPDSVSHSTLAATSAERVSAEQVSAEQVSADGVGTQLPAAATMIPGAVNEPPPPVEMPARTEPVVTTDRTAAARGGEHLRAVASKRVKTGSSSARRRGREPDSADSFATRPLGFQLSPFAHDTRPGRRRDWGGSWAWFGSFRSR
jgi:hypothetical protein